MELRVGAASAIVKDPREAVFRVDLVQQALGQLSFLQTVSSTATLQNPAVLEHALRRYEFLWLPLAAKYPEQTLVAPLDIEWIWHCHLLAPVSYQEDCTNVVGRIVDHRLVPLKDREELLKTSGALWRQEYPQEPFSLDLSKTDASFATRNLPASAVSKISYDILSAASRQQAFFYQVSLPHFRDLKFLTDSLSRYRHFLYLKQQNPDKFIVPCYDQDLLWHTHMLHPLIYKTDMDNFLGTTLPHDDSVNDRNKGSKLSRAQNMTQDLWKDTLGMKFSRYGSMYRGNPPQGKLHPVRDHHISNMVTRIAAVRLGNLQLRTVPQSSGKVMLQMWTSANKKAKSSVCTLNVYSLHQSAVNIPSFNTKVVNGVKCQLVQKKGFACCGSTVILEENDVDVLSLIHKACDEDRPSFSVSHTMTLGEIIIVGIRRSRVTMDLRLEESRFQCTLQGAGLGKGDKGDELLPMQRVPPLRVTDVVQGRAKGPYSLATVQSQEFAEHS